MAPIDGPFDAGIFAEATIASEQYIINTEPDSKGWLGTVAGIPTVFARGDSCEQCEAQTRDALIVALATMLEAGVKPPIPPHLDANYYVEVRDGRWCVLDNDQVFARCYNQADADRVARLLNLGSQLLPDLRTFISSISAKMNVLESIIKEPLEFRDPVLAAKELSSLHAIVEPWLTDKRLNWPQ